MEGPSAKQLIEGLAAQIRAHRIAACLRAGLSQDEAEAIVDEDSTCKPAEHSAHSVTA